MNLPYTMTPQEAAEGVRAFHPAVVYPYHFRGSDTAAFAKALEGSGVEVRVRSEWYPK
jgi:L-ascorbate metabolism protein UlaG (beta-lactamase superfamily)